jgi:hypothetical protein
MAVFQVQVDACTHAASALAGKYEPGEALTRWMQRYVDFITTKRGKSASVRLSAWSGSWVDDISPMRVSTTGRYVTFGAIAVQFANDGGRWAATPLRARPFRSQVVECLVFNI